MATHYSYELMLEALNELKRMSCTEEMLEGARYLICEVVNDEEISTITIEKHAEMLDGIQNV